MSQRPQFSPDGTIAYATYTLSNGFQIEIYGFNPMTAGVTQRGSDPPTEPRGQFHSLGTLLDGGAFRVGAAWPSF